MSCRRSGRMAAAAEPRRPALDCFRLHDTGTAGIKLGSHLRALRKDVVLAACQFLLLLTFMAHQAWSMIDAIARTLFRLFLSRRNLLQWVTAAQANLSPQLHLGSAYGRMSGGVALAVAAAGLISALRPEAWRVGAAFLVLL